MPSDPEPLSDAEIDAALRELVGDELARGGRTLGSVPPAVAAAHVRRAAEISRGDVARVAGIDEARVRRAAGLARRRRRIGVAAGWAAASIVVLGGASTGLAAAEVLPRPAARVFAAGFDAVGLPVPSPVERAAATPEPTTTTVHDDGETQLAAGTTETDPPSDTEPQPEWPTTVELPPVAAVQSTDTTATTRTTAPSTTTTTTPQCREGTTTTSAPSSSSASTSTSSSSTSSTSTSTTLLPNATVPPPAGCERDPGAEGAGADPEPTTTTTVPAPHSSTTTTSLPAAEPDPVASTDG